MIAVQRTPLRTRGHQLPCPDGCAKQVQEKTGIQPTSMVAMARWMALLVLLAMFLMFMFLVM